MTSGRLQGSRNMTYPSLDKRHTHAHHKTQQHPGNLKGKCVWIEVVQRPLVRRVNRKVRVDLRVGLSKI